MQRQIPLRRSMRKRNLKGVGPNAIDDCAEFRANLALIGLSRVGI
jgi:hypothetical protein